MPWRNLWRDAWAVLPTLRCPPETDAIGARTLPVMVALCASGDAEDLRDQLAKDEIGTGIRGFDPPIW
jgi:hypothetical protein